MMAMTMIVKGGFDQGFVMMMTVGESWCYDFVWTQSTWCWLKVIKGTRELSMGTWKSASNCLIPVEMNDEWNLASQKGDFNHQE